jgi:hypothetical protein
MFGSLNKTSDGGYILSGRTNSPENSNLWLVKLNSEGPVPLTSFIENFDEVATPFLPENWTADIQTMLSNTIVDVSTTMHGTAPSAPNVAFIMNGLDGSNGQLDTTAFVALVSPLVEIGALGNTLSFWANSSNPIIIGTMSNPTDSTTFVPIQEFALTTEFAQYSLTIINPGITYLAFKHANVNTCVTLFVDDILFAPVLPTSTLAIASSNNIYPGNVSIPVQATNIVKMTSFQFTIQYNPEIMEFSGASDWFSGINDITVNEPVPGHLTFSWTTDGDGINIANGNFFNLNFYWQPADVINTEIAWSDNPTLREFKNQYGMTFIPKYVNGNENGFGVEINENDTKSVNIYPNPAMGSISVFLSDNISKIQLINYQGMEVYSANNIRNKTIRMNTSNYPSGNYLIKITKENGDVLTRKIIILN